MNEIDFTSETGVQLLLTESAPPTLTVSDVSLSKTCTRCGVEKPLSEFYFKKRLNGPDSHCKVCTREASIVYKRAHAEETKAAMKAWIAKNSDKVRATARKTYAKNAVRLAGKRWEEQARDPEGFRRKYREAWHKYVSSQANKIAGNLRSRLRDALHGRVKLSSAVRDLGCTSDELRAYLEDQFEDWMTWDNYGNKPGQWSIDHIVPFEAVDLGDLGAQKKINHYSNLRPLGVEANLARNRIGAVETELVEMGLWADGKPIFPCDLPSFTS